VLRLSPSSFKTGHEARLHGHLWAARRPRTLDDRVRHSQPARQLCLGHGFATWQFLLIINGILLLLGCFLEVTATLLLVLPILAPALQPLGVDPVHFSIIFMHNMEIGLVHPPVGLNLFVLSTISSAPVGEVIRGILLFLILLLMVLGSSPMCRS
jgi:TRAP-type C4-dicarboxylate transport system permease large subunit